VEFDEAALIDEIESLRVGAAARDPSLLEQLGPQLRQACRITEQDPPRRKAAKLRGTIELLLDDRPALRIPLLAILGLHPKAQQETPGKRLDSVIGEIHVGLRTAYRRADEAISVFAHLAAADARAASMAAQLGFTLISFRGTLVFTGDQPSFVEQRRIRVTTEELTAIPGAFAIREPPPGQEPSLAIEVTSGGIRCDEIQFLGSAVKYLVKLWRPLVRGETFEYTVKFSFQDGRLMAPFYVLSPLTVVGTADMSATFDPNHLPARVRRVNGVLPTEVEHWPPDNPDRLDPSGRIDAAFLTMQQGWCYGLAWSW
jgi:hypothetical protein